MKVEIDDRNSRVRVESNGRIVIDFQGFPAAELTIQLREWVNIVDDKTATSFIFQSIHPEWFATFRIVPRPELWQFSSWKERFHSPELLSLDEWKYVLQSAGV